MNFKKKLLILFSCLAFIIPTNIFAYSDKVILGGNNIGITVNIKEILVVGFYKVDGQNIASLAGIKIGDKITHIGNVAVKTIDEMISLINEKMENNAVEITVLRNNKYLNFNLKLVEDNNGTYKTSVTSITLYTSSIP